MIFSDFDNTMMNYYGNKNFFDEYRIKVLKKLKNKGIKFSVVTGRSILFFLQFPELLEVIDYIIGSNGACIYDVRNKKVIYNSVIDYDILGQLTNYCVIKQYSFILNCMDKRYLFGEWNNSVNAYQYVLGNKYGCDQMIISFSKKYKDEIINSIEYFKKIKINNVADWDDSYSIDINNIGVSKGNSIVWLCNKYNIDMKDTIAFGDGSNDLSMFEVVDKGFAVGNASDNVKNMASGVINNSDEDGIYKYIEENILK